MPITLLAQEKKSNDPIWYVMMQDPKVNFREAVQAYEKYWEASKLPRLRELHEMEEDKYKKYFVGLNQADMQEYVRILLLNKTFESWMQEEASWVQPDGRVLSQAEKQAIIDKQRAELKAIERKNGKN